MDLRYARDTPGVLGVVGESVACKPPAHALKAGEAARIFTGAPLPDGADAILVQQDAERSGEGVRAPRVAAGSFVRAAGTDFAAGAVLLAAGRKLDAGALTLAAAGCAHVQVARRPACSVPGGRRRDCGARRGNRRSADL